MLKGLELENPDTPNIPDPVIIRDDNAIIAISKPSGMPSVPGLDGRPSAQEWAEEKCGPLHTVHRLDMDTSGVLLFAKTPEVAVKMQKQFEDHNISKKYIARLCPCSLAEGDNGSISLPLSADHDERPRQKVDRQQGKYATTFYKVIKKNSDGTIDIEFLPITGRTHQLRVHSAHHLGLGSPILGDMLYGGHGSASLRPQRLHLHASSITFKHPTTGKEVTICSSEHSF
jgi:tRNA pseudouridine32 synthase/23S rRNA pseudouridine746 synthase